MSVCFHVGFFALAAAVRVWRLVCAGEGVGKREEEEEEDESEEMDIGCLCTDVGLDNFGRSPTSLFGALVLVSS